MIIEPYSTTGLEFMPGLGYLTLFLQSHCAHNLPQQITHSSLYLIHCLLTGRENIKPFISRYFNN